MVNRDWLPMAIPNPDQGNSIRARNVERPIVGSSPITGKVLPSWYQWGPIYVIDLSRANRTVFRVTIPGCS